MLHHMHLQPTAFHLILSGTKTIEVRINDEKRQALRIGDTVDFSLLGNNAEHFVTRVIQLYQCDSFEKLYALFPPKDFGGTTREELLREIYKIYSREDEKKFGVVGIRIKILSI